MNCEREAKRARAKRTEGEAQAEPEESGATGSEAACESCAVLKVREKRRRRASAEESKEENSQTISGDNSLREPPVPIPNTEVKPQHAEGTWLETARETRSSPDSISEDVLATSSLFAFWHGASKRVRRNGSEDVPAAPGLLHSFVRQILGADAATASAPQFPMVFAKLQWQTAKRRRNGSENVPAAPFPFAFIRSSNTGSGCRGDIRSPIPDGFRKVAMANRQLPAGMV